MGRDAGELWKVGELARSTGLTVRTLHHYDQVGLLRPSGRTASGHRLYDAGDVDRLYQVVALRALGLSLDAIRAVLAGPPNVQVLLHEHLDRLDRQLIALRALRRRVAAVVAGADAAGKPAAADLLDLIREVITVDETVSSYVNARTPMPDPTFYRSPAEAVAAPPETLAYVVAFDRSGRQPDALSVVDVDETSPEFGSVVGWTDLPTTGDELHHFGWNACSSALAHAGHHGGAEGLQRRFLLLPGLRSSNVHVLDTRPDARAPRLHKTITPDELGAKSGYSRPHTLHCGPDGIFLSCLGGANGADGPGGIALLDHDTFDVLRAFETDRGPQYLAYDAWWHLSQNTLITSEWGTPSMIEDGVVPELLLGNKYGHRLHFWDLAKGVHQQTIDLGADQQMVLEIRPAHDPEAAWGYVGVVVSHHGSVGVRVALAPRRRCHGLDRRQGDHHSGRAGRPRGPAAGAAPVRGGATAGLRHQPVGRRPHALRVVLGHRRLQAVRRVGPRPPAGGRLGAAGRDRVAGHPSGRSRRAARRRPTDGRGQPGRAPDLPDQLPVRRLGRPVLPRRRRRLDGEDRH